MVAEPLASSSGSDDGTSLPPAPSRHLAFPQLRGTHGWMAATSPCPSFSQWLSGGVGGRLGRGGLAWQSVGHLLCVSPHFRAPRGSPISTFPTSQTHPCTYCTLLPLCTVISLSAINNTSFPSSLLILFVSQSKNRNRNPARTRQPSPLGPVGGDPVLGVTPAFPEMKPEAE